MRPLVLRMSAFGPYSGIESLDFRVLRGNPLFLIHGATGAGKTSILDAISFALYGDSSGAERDGRSMRSDFAPPDQTTFVELCFSLGDRCFRVRRVPEQERLKKRGEGTTTQQAEATLWELSGTGEASATGKVLGTRWTSVTAKIEELLGFRSGQFRQVIILPQGRFRELLTARSDQREAILETLFDTERFRHIEQALRQRAKALRVRVETLGERRKTYLDAAGKRVAGADKVLEEARQLSAKFRALEDARIKLGELERQLPDIADARETLARAQRAAALDDLASQRETAQTQLGTAESELGACRAALDQAQQTAARTREAVAEAGKRRAERERHMAEVNRLEALRAQLQPLEEARLQLEAAEAAMTEADQNWAALVQETADRESRRQQTLNEIETLRKIWSGYPPVEEGIEASANLRRQWEELETGRARLGDLEVRLGAAEAAEKHAGEEFEQRRAAVRLQQAQQLPVLAAALVDGEPCPVCGSREHPEPARGELDLEVADDGLSDPLALVSAETELERARERTTAAVREVAEQRARVEGREKTLGENAQLSRSDLEQAERELRDRLGEQQAAQSELERLQELYKEIVESVQSRDGVAKEIEQMATRAREQRASARTRVAERQGSVPERYREPGALQLEIDGLRAAVAAIDRETESASEAHASADRLGASARTAMEKAETALENAAKHARECDTRWSVRRKQAGFDDDVGYLEARLGSAEIERGLSAIEAFDNALHTAEVRARDAQQGVAGLTPPDLAGLELEATSLREELSAAEIRHGSLVERRRALAATVGKIGAAGAELAALEATYADAGRISQVARGDNPFRMSFQRFVLAALLDDVLISASRRLHSMSKGRYRLQRVTREGGRRRPGGLDLEVDDAYTGKTRAVTTLSGGEGFQAALALALGLADVVQSYAGGIRLDTMFIDEGFGSLDPEALELAIDTLVDLQASGRLIGVISHVPELKERIPTRLEVLAGTAGSNARFSAAP
ncbi:MAG: SMC family ATPase [Chromatiales bacterium]